MVYHSTALFSQSWYTMAWPCSANHCIQWHGPVQPTMVYHGMALFSQPGPVQPTMVYHGTALFSQPWYTMTCYMHISMISQYYFCKSVPDNSIQNIWMLFRSKQKSVCHMFKCAGHYLRFTWWRLLNHISHDLCTWLRYLILETWLQYCIHFPTPIKGNIFAGSNG